MAAVDMGEVEEVHCNEEGPVLNGNTSDTEMETQECDSTIKKIGNNTNEPMDVDETENSIDDESKDVVDGNHVSDVNKDENNSLENGISNDECSVDTEDSKTNSENNKDKDNNGEIVNEDENSVECNKQSSSVSTESEENEERTCDDEVEKSDSSTEEQNEEAPSEEVEEVNDSDKVEKKKEDESDVHEIDEDDDVIHIENKENGTDKEKEAETIDLNDSGAEEGEVMFVDHKSPAPKENGTADKQEVTEVIELTTPDKKIPEGKGGGITPRRSSRNLNKQKSYVEEEEEENAKAAAARSDEESDIEEILPEDPLANIGDAIQIEKIPVKRKPLPNISDSAAIVVKDTKKLVEIASKSNPPVTGKKEPTLVIIDTNSILSGRGPVPINKSGASINVSSQSAAYPVLPMALPAQGMYPPNMRATITPIPIATTNQHNAQSLIKNQNSSPSVPVLPTLTDDMFVVEAPSFIVPYVYEKPPVKNLKVFVCDYKKEVEKADKEKRGGKDDKDKSEKEEDKKKEEDGEKDKKEEAVVSKEKEKKKGVEEDDRMYSYFSSPLGKFFIDIGLGLVQEFVQTDLLRQQKRKRDREQGKNPETLKTIQSLAKNLEYTKENNEPYKLKMKKCEYCPFKSESALALSYHLETPHVKNYVYKCNFCAYETRSPHDILFHMEAEHMVRGRLERALSFHQCPNCPFEENQKGKLSRHLMACGKKFKPDRNLEPPLDWEPPAKIPRVPKMRMGVNPAAYQAMAKATAQQQQFQLLTKMQLQNASAAQLSAAAAAAASSASPHMVGMAGRGRGSRGGGMAGMKAQLMRQGGHQIPGMVYKQTMSGGSVLVPTSYQLSGNQVFTVVGGQELSGRLGPAGHMYFPTSGPSQQQQSPKTKPTNTPSISITPLPRASTSSSSANASSPSAGAGSASQQAKPGDTNSKNSFVICEICDGYIKDLEQLRNHMQWIHKVKIHPKMIYNRPPLNCQKCQFRFFTDQGLERHLLGSHGLVTSSMQEAANRSKDAGRCPVCGRVYQWKLLNHVARDHNMTLKPAHLSYKCTVCTATFGMYKQFENHVYSAHSVVAKRVMDKKSTTSSSSSSSTAGGGQKGAGSASEQSSSSAAAAAALKPLKINDEITIIPQPAKAGSSKEDNNKGSSSKNQEQLQHQPQQGSSSSTSSSSSRAERLARRQASGADD